MPDNRRSRRYAYNPPPPKPQFNPALGCLWFGGGMATMIFIVWLISTLVGGP